jgi:hypothetical protein
MRARKVQINASNKDSQPERFYTAREAQKAADDCNFPFDIYPVIVGCCGPRFYVLLADDGETVKYYSALSETWIPVCAEEEGGQKDVLDAEELEVIEEAAVAQVECEDQGEGDSMNETGFAAGKEQISAADAMAMDFLLNLAKEEGYKVSCRWENYGCNPHYRADKGKVVLVFDGPDTLPDVETERGKYCFGSYFTDEKTGSFIDRLYQFFNLRVEHGYKIPADGPNGFEYQCSSWGPVLSMDIDEMLLTCQQVGGSKGKPL